MIEEKWSVFHTYRNEGRRSRHASEQFSGSDTYFYQTGSHTFNNGKWRGKLDTRARADIFGFDQRLSRELVCLQLAPKCLSSPREGSFRSSQRSGLRKRTTYHEASRPLNCSREAMSQLRPCPRCQQQVILRSVPERERCRGRRAIGAEASRWAAWG
jgi:hypothetical protein